VVCFDANILLEVILERKNEHICREMILTNKEDSCISLLTLDIVMYYVEREKVQVESVEEFLGTFIWLPIEESDARWAFAHFSGNDFEDALQISCALREQASRFVTLDKKLASKYSEVVPITLL
jgi:predicted nucleic acid-binding protein